MILLRECFSLMMGKCTAMPINDTILVTRGAGFIGANFVLSAAIRAVLERGRVGETYNIGGNSERRNLDVVTTLCDLVDEMRPDGKLGSRRSLITFVKDRPGHDRRYAIDASKISRELGWFPSERFENGLRRTVRWYLDHLDWVESVRTGAYLRWIEQNYTERLTS